jgi:hypothetical protein
LVKEVPLDWKDGADSGGSLDWKDGGQLRQDLEEIVLEDLRESRETT